MMKIKFIFCCSVLILLTHCFIIPTINPIRRKKEIINLFEFIAYDVKWKKYIEIESRPVNIKESLYGFSESRVITSKIEYLEYENGERINIVDNILSLRKNGKFEKYSLKKTNEVLPYEPYFLVFSNNNKIFIELIDGPKRVTDCLVHPPNNEIEITDEKFHTPRLAIFFGKFDIFNKQFLIDSFVDKYDENERKVIKGEKSQERLYLLENSISYKNLCNY